MAEKGKCLHDGHRERLRAKVEKGSLKSLETHEVLELLLTYSIPRKNTNDIAHSLLNTFGSFNGVVNADYKDLLKVKGVGSRTALFLTMFPQLFDIYKNKTVKDKRYLRNTHECVEFFRSNYEIKSNESMYAVCVNSMGKCLKVVELAGKDASEVEFNIQELTSNIIDVNTSSIVLFHTHPGGSVSPSLQDINATKDIAHILGVLRISVLDHIILNETEHYSFGTNGDLINIYKTIFKETPGCRGTIKSLFNKIDFSWDNYKSSFDSLFNDKK